MRGFVATYVTIFVICCVAGCESAPASDGTTRYAAWSPYNGPGSDPVLAPPAPDAQPPEKPVPAKQDGPRPAHSSI